MYCVDQNQAPTLEDVELQYHTQLSKANTSAVLVIEDLKNQLGEVLQVIAQKDELIKSLQKKLNESTSTVSVPRSTIWEKTSD